MLRISHAFQVSGIGILKHKIIFQKDENIFIFHSFFFDI